MSETEMSNLEVKSNLLIKTLLIAGGVNWGTTALGYNVVEGLSRGINRLVKRNLYIDKIVYWDEKKSEKVCYLWSISLLHFCFSKSIQLAIFFMLFSNMCGHLCLR
jgi:hypothetical protein